MKKTLLAFLVLAVSCSYEQKISVKGTSFSIVPEVVKSNYATVSILPEDDRVLYIADCLEKEMIDDFLSRKSENVLMQTIIDSTVRHYNRWRANKYLEDESNGFQDRYLGTYEDIELYYAENSIPFVLLEEDTEYYILVFGVNPKKMIPAGELQKTVIRTALRSPEESRLRLDFMVKENNGEVCCYARPTIGGKISRDPYIADYASVSEIAGYGSLEDYIKAMNDLYYENYLSVYLNFDISRSIPHLYGDWEEGQDYVIFGFPYIPNYEDYIQKLTVTYHKGIYVPYSQDPQE